MYELEFTFKRFEDRYAILDNEATGEIRWPIVDLPEDVNPNDKIKLKLITEQIQHNENLNDLKKTLEGLVN